MNSRTLTLLLAGIVLLGGVSMMYMATTHTAPTIPYPETPTGTPQDTTPTEPQTPEEAPNTIDQSALENLGQQVLTAFEKQEPDVLQTLIHPSKGLRFTPYGYINTDQDRVLTALKFPEAYQSTEEVLWGYQDASGEPLMMTTQEYIAEFITDHDYRDAPEIYINEFTEKGLTLNNIEEAYPNAQFIEYHFPGFDPNTEGMDWESLRLAFEEYEGTWYLVGIVHTWHSI